MFAFSFYIIFLISYFLHLPSRIPLFAEIRLDLVLMAFVFISMIFKTKSKAQIREKDHSTKYLHLLILYILVTIPLVEWPGSVIRYGIENMLKVIMFYYFTLIIIDSEKKLKILFGVFIFLQIIRILEPTYLNLTSGYWGDKAVSMVGGKTSVLHRLEGAPHDVVNSNQFAWVIVNVTPFLYFMGWKGRGVIRILSFILTPVFIYALLMTGSRSGLLSLLVVVFSILWLGENKIKRILIGITLLIPLWILVSGELNQDQLLRYRSLYDESAIGADTAAGRIRGLERNLTTIGSALFFGHGLGTSYETSANFDSGRAQISHNLYIEILQELGIFGFILFLIYIQGMWRNVMQIKSTFGETTHGKAWMWNLSISMQVWMIMDMFYSLSCFGLSSWEWYLFGGVSAAGARLAIRQSICPIEGEKKLTRNQQNVIVIPA